jgi:hypothetical protein
MPVGRIDALGATAGVVDHGLWAICVDQLGAGEAADADASRSRMRSANAATAAGAGVEPPSTVVTGEAQWRSV